MADISSGANIDPLFPADLNLNIRFVVLLDYVKGVILYVFLNHGVIPFSPDEPFDVEDGVLWVGRQLVFCGIPDKSLPVSVECNVRWSYSISLFVREDFNVSVFKYANTEIIHKRWNGSKKIITYM